MKKKATEEASRLSTAEARRLVRRFTVTALSAGTLVVDPLLLSDQIQLGRTDRMALARWVEAVLNQVLLGRSQ